MTACAAGDSYCVCYLTGSGSAPFPSPTDLGAFVFYPLMLTALVVAVRLLVRRLASSVWLDNAVRSLGAASMPTVRAKVARGLA